MQANRVASSKTPGVGHNWDSVCNFLADGYRFKSLTRQYRGAGLAGGLIYHPQAGTQIARRHIGYFSLLVQVLQHHDEGGIRSGARSFQLQLDRTGQIEITLQRSEEHTSELQSPVH